LNPIQQKQDIHDWEKKEVRSTEVECNLDVKKASGEDKKPAKRGLTSKKEE
jgi:hypothetical protein